MSGILFFDELPLFLRNIANLKKLKEGVEWVVCSKQVSVNSFQYAVVIINKRLAKDDKKLFDGPFRLCFDCAAQDTEAKLLFPAWERYLTYTLIILPLWGNCQLAGGMISPFEGMSGMLLCSLHNSSVII
jgi:hypothetical protein